MTTATATPAQSIESDADQCVVFPDVGWKGYATLLKLRGERRQPRMVYLDESVTLVSPSYLHELMTRLAGLFVFVIAEELEIPCRGARSTTLRRRSKKGGVEGDETFYFTNLDRMRGKRTLNLRTDPPPDLAIEVVISHDADDAVEVYRRLGVREVWICDQCRVTILRLGEDGQYAESERSEMIPTLRAAEIHPWVTRNQDDSDQAWARELRRWVAEVLAPRYQENQAIPE